MEWTKRTINTNKYHVFAPMGRFQLESIGKGKLILKENHVAVIVLHKGGI